MIISIIISIIVIVIININSNNIIINNIISGMSGNSSSRNYFNDWRRKWRYLWTGHESKRIRDHLKDKIKNQAIRIKNKNPPTIKLLDKITFTLGVLNISFVQYFLFVKPTYFWLWYSIVIPLLMITRFFHFKSLGWHYFMLGMLINQSINQSIN